MIKRLLASFFIFFFISNVFSQKKITHDQYINKYYRIAVKEMKEYKIPASITLAQGILESGSGNSSLSKKAKNHFGIKCHSDWNGKRYYMDDDAKDECFRVYNNAEESFKDHSLFLSKRGRYEFLFTDYATTDYVKWAKGLRKAGYATNPKYPQLLISLIERYELYKYDSEDYQPSNIEEEEFLALEEITDHENFVLEETDQYIKALMGKNVYYSNAKKGIFIFNRIKTIKAKGRAPLQIAVAYEIDYESLKKYNELKGNDKFGINQNVFLQPKRFKGSQKKYLVKPGDSMHDISQMFGIKLKSLYKKNLMTLGQQAKPGETLYLKKKRTDNVRLIQYRDVLKAKRKYPKEKPKTKPKKAENIVNETTININIIDKSPNSDIEIEKPSSQNIQVIQTQEKYSKDKYVEKNDVLEKAITDPIDEKTTTIDGKKIIKHVVLQGETLYFISKKYNSPIEEIKKANSLPDNNIDIGQQLIIPSVL